MRRSLWALALGMLVVIDAALVLWALRPGDQAAPDLPVASASSTTSTVAAAATTSSSVAAKPDRVIVVPMNAQSAWRVVTGSACTGSVTVSRSQDAGATWTAGPKVDLRMVSSVAADGSGKPVLTGLDASCKPATVLLEQAGAKGTDTAPEWAVNPMDPSGLLHSGKATAKACPAGTVKDLATDTAERANVLCAGGEVRRTTDAGATWSKVGAVKDATGISTASSGQGYRVYVASKQDCGIRVAALVDEAAGSASGCVDASKGGSGVDIAIWGRSIWVADQARGWVVPMASAPAPSTTTTTQSSTESSTQTSASATQPLPTSTSNPLPSSTSQWTPSSTRQWTPSQTRTRTRTTQPPISTFPTTTDPATTDPTTVQPPAGEVTGNALPSGLATVATGQ